MATAPQYKLHRTCSMPVADTNPFTGGNVLGHGVNAFGGLWFAYNFPALTDAGDYVLAWEGYVYDTGEFNDPFYFHGVKIKKSTFTIEGEFFIPLIDRAAGNAFNPYNDVTPFYTVAGIAVKSGFIYLMAWCWFSRWSGNDTFPSVDEAHGTYFVAVVDLATMTLQSVSNFIRIDGFRSVFSTGGTERDCSCFIFGDNFYAGAEFNGYVFRYSIHNQILEVLPSGFISFEVGDPSTTAAYTFDHTNGILYRLSWADYTTMYLDRATDSGFDEVGFGSIEGYRLSYGNNNGNASVYCDVPNKMIYFEALDSVAFNSYWLQVSTETGRLVRAIPNPFPAPFFPEIQPYEASDQSSATPELPWSGFAPAVFQFGSANDTINTTSVEFFFRDKDNNMTREAKISGLPPDPPVDDGFGNMVGSSIALWPDPELLLAGDSTPNTTYWDILFTKPGKPMYISAETSDLFVDVEPAPGGIGSVAITEIVTFYEYVANPQQPFTQLIT